MLYIDSLLPNTSYQYQASSIQYQVASNELNVTTMDTTSHDFTWQSWTFGEHSSSLLYDVAIINENDIWGVGEIYLFDSLGQSDPHAYNAVHWNGNQWSIKRIPFTGECSAVIYPPITSIFTFAQNDIWFARGGSLVHYNGSEFFNDCGMNSILAGSINKIWGISSEDLYVVGDNGTIVKYNGNYWWSLFSGKESNINDIWGTQINNANNLTLCSVSNIASPGDRKILQIKNNVVYEFLWDTGRRVQSIWFKGANAIYACGGGVFSLKDGVHWQEITEIPLYYTQKIRGVDNNDIMVVGDFGLMAHYNGSTWKVLSGPAADIYYSCAVSKNVVVAVGMKGSKGFIALARK